MKYKAYLYQEGGCDYTIGCGIRVIDIEASNIEEAQKELKNLSFPSSEWSWQASRKTLAESILIQFT